jgi:mRNA interferase MazF
MRKTAGGHRRAVAVQGEVYWASLPAPRGSEPGFRRPVLVIQNDGLNRSAIRTVLVCPLTTHLGRADAPGNVLLEEGEADLPQASVVMVSAMMALDRTFLDERIGEVSGQRVREVVAGIMRVVAPA